MTDKGTAGMVERMTPLQRVVHGVLLLAVLMLVISGLALAYHDRGWAHVLIRLMGGLGGRATLHRAGAILLLLVALYHLAAIVFSATSRENLRRSIPTLGDVKLGWAGFLYRTVGRGEPPRYGHFTPMQKFQCWLFVLAFLAMGVSGAVLWSPKVALGLFPKRFFDLMLVVHSSEAQFAFILLIVWHLWDVHVAGGNFPMNPAWLTGKMREDLFKVQHLGEWESTQRGTKE